MSVEQIFITVFALMISVIGHEIMHGLSALYFGDTTAKDEGRLSINPIKHIDLIGTIILPAILIITNAGFVFGWAKPVPINTRVVLSKAGNNGMLIVSLAGIAYNLALAFVASKLIGTQMDMWNLFLLNLVFINILLALFNLLPIPPLDGSNAVIYIANMLGLRAISEFYEKIAPYGFIVLLVFIAIPQLNKPFFLLVLNLTEYFLS